MKRLVLPFTLAMSACGASQTVGDAASIPGTPDRLPPGFEYPNGIAAASDGTLYIGSITSGTLLRIRPEHAPEVLLEDDPALFAGTALELDPATHQLWVSSPAFLGQARRGRIGVVDADDGHVLWSTPVPEGAFLNDIALDGHGGAYFTDSSLGRIWHLAAPRGTFEVFAADPLLEGAGIGSAGIVRTPKGELIVGQYDAGTLVRVSPDGTVERLPIAGKLHNPDGLELSEDARLLVAEGALDDGNGRVLSIDLMAPAPHPVETLASGLDTPTNLVRVGGEVVVSESRIRHKMRPALALPTPTTWRLVRVRVPPPTRSTGPVATLPEDFFPESIARDEDGRFYLGSASRSEVIRVSPGGAAKIWVAAQGSGLMSVQGLLATDTTLYVCTGDLGQHETPTVPASLSAYDLETSRLDRRWPLPGGFCNDLDRLPDGRIVITDTLGARLWVVSPSTRDAAVVIREDPKLAGANGLATNVEGTEVFVTTFPDGRLLRVGLEPPLTITQLQLPRALDGGDALRRLEDGRLLVFENGLVQGTGRVTLVELGEDAGTLTTLVETSAAPTSGVIVDGAVVWAASNFGLLFGGKKGTYDRRLYRTALPPRRPSPPR